MVLVALVATMLTAALSQTVVGTAMPKIVADLGGLDLYTWLATSYLLASTIVVPLSGRFSDIWGRKPFFLAGVFVFLVGSWASGLANTMNWLIAARAVQGLGGGMLMAMNTITVGDIFPPAQRGRWQGLMMSLFALATLFGPTLGGWITDNLSWRWVFYINAPFGILALILLWYALPAKARNQEEKVKINLLSPLFLTVALVSLLLGFTFAQQDLSWTTTRVVAGLAAAVAFGIIFFIVDSRQEESLSLLPLWLFKNNVFVVSSVILFLITMAMFAQSLYLPMYLQVVSGITATSSGALLTPMMLSLMVAAIISGQLISSFKRYKWFAVAGIGVAATGMFLLSRLNPDATLPQVTVRMIISGLGMGIAMPTFNVAIQNTVGRSQLGVVTAASQLFRSLGGVFGAAFIGNLVISDLQHKLSNLSLPGTNPGAVDPGQVMSQIMNPAAGMADNPLLTVFRDAFSASVTHAFAIGAMLMALGLVLTFFLEDRELKSSWDEEKPAAEREATGVPAAESSPGHS